MPVRVPAELRIYREHDVMDVDTRLSGKSPVKTRMGIIVPPEDYDTALKKVEEREAERDRRKLVEAGEALEEQNKDAAAMNSSSNWTDGIQPKGSMLMYPNSTFIDKYQDVMNELYPQEVEGRPKETLFFGMFVLLLAIANKLGLYKLLCDVFGTYAANGIMDFAMYSILYEDTSINKMAGALKNQFLFSIKAHSEAWYSNLFKNVITTERIHDFQEKWIEKQKKVGLEDTIISVDGTNQDCESKSNQEAKYGNDKSGKGLPVVGSIWAVRANGDYKGMPLAYSVNPGNVPDQSAVLSLLTLLRNHNINPTGVVADRGFCSNDFMKLCDGLGMPFLVMMKDGTGKNKMISRHSEEIRWKSAHRLDEAGKFGISEDDVQIFKDHKDRKCCVGLIFDGIRAASSARDFIEETDGFIHEIEKKIANAQAYTMITDGEDTSKDKNYLITDDKQSSMHENVLEKLNIKIPDKYKNIVRVETDSKGKASVLIDYDEYDRNILLFGFYALSSSIHMTANEMVQEYSLRDASEKMVSQLKSEVGASTLGVSGDASFHGKLLCIVCTIILRCGLLHACRVCNENKKSKIDINSFIKNINSIKCIRSNGHYRYTGYTSEEQRKILAQFDILHLEELFRLESQFNAVLSDNVESLRQSERVFPDETKRRKPGRKPKKKSINSDSSSNNSRKSTVSDAINNETPNKQIDEVGSQPPINVEGLLNGINVCSQSETPTENNDKTTTKTVVADDKELDTVDRKSKKPQKGKGIMGRPPGKKNKATILQEERDRKLSEITGIDILGSPPPLPWTSNQRYAIMRQRKIMRRKAEERYQEMKRTETSDTDLQ